MLCTFGFVDDVIFSVLDLWRDTCIPHNNKHSSLVSNQILLNSTDQQVLIVSYSLGRSLTSMLALFVYLTLIGLNYFGSFCS